MLRNSAAALTFVLLIAAGCGPEPVTGRPPPNPPGSPAVSSSGTRDASVTIPVDTGAEAHPEAGADARLDADAAARADADADAPVDVGADARVDAGADPEVSPGADSTLDAATDAAGDAATDAVSPQPGTRVPVVGDLVIDEILANPTGQDLGREWVEIASRALDPLDLSSLHIADATTDVAVAAGTLAPGALIVLGQSADPNKNGGAPVEAAYGTHLILNNDGEQISICLGPCAIGLVLDEVSWGTVGADYDGHALVVDTTTRAICPATAPFGTAGDFGTPGQPNPQCSTTDAGSTNAGGD